MHATYLVERTGKLVAAYIGHNAVPAASLPALIACVGKALADLHAFPPGTRSSARPTATEIAASLGQDNLISFLDGKPYRSLKRHLAANGHDPHSYRTRFGLAADYPMTAPDYTALRSRIAKQIRLGRKAL